MFVQSFGQAIGMSCMCWVSLTLYPAFVLRCGKDAPLAIRTSKVHKMKHIKLNY